MGDKGCYLWWRASWKGGDNVEDHQIVEFYLRREEEAVRQTQEKYGRRLYHLALGIVGDVQAAQECENDTYFQA